MVERQLDLTGKSVENYYDLMTHVDHYYGEFGERPDKVKLTESQLQKIENDSGFVVNGQNAEEAERVAQIDVVT